MMEEEEEKLLSFFFLFREEKTEGLVEAREELEKYVAQASKLRQEVR